MTFFDWIYDAQMLLVHRYNWHHAVKLVKSACVCLVQHKQLHLFPGSRTTNVSYTICPICLSLPATDADTARPRECKILRVMPGMLGTALLQHPHLNNRLWNNQFSTGLYQSNTLQF